VIRWFGTFLLVLTALPSWAANIVSAEFTQPTERYDHCVLGDCVEYGALRAVLEDGQELTYRLPADSVFEDIAPRLVPLGLNGRTALLVVRSYLDRGSALALLDRKGKQLQIVAESEPIGTPHRWQNPIGVGNFDRDAKLEIASVITPHIGGTLILYERQGHKLVQDKTAYAFSNHRIHSSQLDLHEIIDWNGDKIDDIALPGVTHHRLSIVTFAKGKAEIIAQKELDGLIEGPVSQTGGQLVIPLDSGTLQTWTRPSP